MENKKLWAYGLNAIGIFLIVMVAVVCFPFLNDLACDSFGPQLQKFCGGSKSQVDAPMEITTEVVYERIEAIEINAIIAEWSGKVCTDANSDVPVTPVDNTDIVTQLTTGFQSLVDKGHNALRSEQISNFCAECTVPITIKLNDIKVTKTGFNTFTIRLPEPYFYDPGCDKDSITIGQVNSKMLPEFEERKKQLLEETFSSVLGAAETQAQSTYAEKRAEVLCDAHAEIVRTLSSLSGGHFNYAVGGDSVDCGGLR